MAWGRRRSTVLWLVLALVGLTPFGAAPAGAATAPDYTVLGTISLCGVHNFGTFTVPSGSTLRVANVASNANTTGAGPDCPAGSQNKLMIRADRIIVNGWVTADALQAAPFTPELLPCDPPYQPPTGNSGGGHSAFGGNGSTGVGGSPYDSLNCLSGLDFPGAPGFNPGAPGAGTGPGGKGGGLVMLVSNSDVVVNGEVSARGEDGTANTTGACATGGTPNTGTPAPRGGGAGGMIVIVGRTVGIANYGNLSVRGGDGGASHRGPSGGGSAGMVVTMGRPNPEMAVEPDIAVGQPGTNLCPGDPASNDAESGQGGSWALFFNVYTGISTQASAGSPAGVRDVATLLGAGPTGTVTFRLFSDQNCTNQVFTSTDPVTDGTATSSDFMPAAAGTYYWTAAYSGDTVNLPVTSPCNAPNESVTVSKASPTIATQASPGNLAGAPVRDVATISGGQSPTGTVTFRLFSDANCNSEVFMSTNTLAGTTATSDWFTPAAPGMYRWTAHYSGDGLNNAATSGCNAPNESVAISPFQAPSPTQTITGDFVGPVTVNAGQSVAISNARVVGPVTVNPGGALTIVNSQVSRGITANAPAFLSVCGTQVSGPSPGVALSVTNAPVPIRVGDPATGCAGNRFAGQVVLTANLAVTFGANTVSHNATIDNNGPGNTVVKANTLFGTLACAGNSPPPANAGQPNTAASKTGQCAGL